jgi:hypothetical protein
MPKIAKAPDRLFTMTAVLPERESPITVYSLPASVVEGFKQTIIDVIDGLDRKKCVYLRHEGVQLLFPFEVLSKTVFVFSPEE